MDHSKITGARIFNAFMGKTTPSAQNPKSERSQTNTGSTELNSNSNEAITGRALAQAQLPDLPDQAILFAEKLLAERMKAGEVVEESGPSDEDLKALEGNPEFAPIIQQHSAERAAPAQEYRLGSREVGEKFLEKLAERSHEPPNFEQITVTE